MTETDCLFCQMASGAIEVEKLHEDDSVFAIHDINPRAPVHVLIVPREHIPEARQIDGSNGQLLTRILVTANQVAERLGVAESGYRLTFNVGDEGGQTISHLHLHLLGGRRLGSEG